MNLETMEICFVHNCNSKVSSIQYATLMNCAIECLLHFNTCFYVFFLYSHFIFFSFNSPQSFWGFVPAVPMQITIPSKWLLSPGKIPGLEFLGNEVAETLQWKHELYGAVSKCFISAVVNSKVVTELIWPRSPKWTDVCCTLWKQYFHSITFISHPSLAVYRPEF